MTIEAGQKKDSSAKTEPVFDSAKTVAVFGSALAPPDHPVLAEAERMGQLLAQAGFTLMTGGYSGTMEAASRGAHQAGGHVIGVTMDLFAPRLQPNRWLTRERRVKDFFPQARATDGRRCVRGVARRHRHADRGDAGLEPAADGADYAAALCLCGRWLAQPVRCLSRRDLYAGS